MNKKKEKLSFEVSFRRLEEILEILEGDNVSLEETIKLYEEGLSLTGACYQKLSEAELRIKEINKSSKGNLEVQDYKNRNSTAN